MRSTRAGFRGGVFAMAEQVAGGLIPDVITQKRSTTKPREDHERAGGVAVAAPPTARLITTVEQDAYAARASRRVDTSPIPSTMPRMVRFGLAIGAMVMLLGCEGSSSRPRSALDQQMFGPASVRIHPTFTQVRDWSGHGKPDGIEATLEIQDQFGEPTRATGRAMFELFGYRKDSPQVRGLRIGGPWIYYLNTRIQQQDHWNPALRSYTFQLPFPKAQKGQYYVLTVQFDLNATASLSQTAVALAPTTGAATEPTTWPATQPAMPAPATQPGGRLFDQLIIEPQGEEKGNGPKYRAPTGAPQH
jgi:hypothetical protein